MLGVGFSRGVGFLPGVVIIYLTQAFSERLFEARKGVDGHHGRWLALAGCLRRLRTRGWRLSGRGRMCGRGVCLSFQQVWSGATWFGNLFQCLAALSAPIEEFSGFCCIIFVCIVYQLVHNLFRPADLVVRFDDIGVEAHSHKFNENLLGAVFDVSRVIWFDAPLVSWI